MVKKAKHKAKAPVTNKKTSTKPEKPLPVAADVTKSEVTRRSFISRFWKGLGIVAGLQLIGGASLFLFTGRKRRVKPKTNLLNAGPISNFPKGSVTLIGKGHLYLAHLDNGGFLAISRRCTHLGCAVTWGGAQKQFLCPCHASVFDGIGNVLKPPASRALDLYSISFERKMVMIDANHPIKRKKFAAEQLAYPDGRG